MWMRQRLTGVWIGGVLISVLAACSGGGSSVTPSPSPSPSAAAQSLEMTVKAGAGQNAGVGTPCGDANFGTLFLGLPGTQVTIKNEAGVTVGLGQVPTSGVIAKRATPGGPLGLFTEDCVFTFTVRLDGEAKFYKFDFGDRFGSYSLSASDLQRQDYKVTFDLTSS
jgi:hypothetical protein